MYCTTLGEPTRVEIHPHAKRGEGTGCCNGRNDKPMTLTEKRSLVALVEGKHDNLKVVKLDGDQFILTAQQAVNACSAASDAVLFQAQFRDLLDKLYDWVEARKEKISSAFISTSQEGILLLIVQRGIKACLLYTSPSPRD